MTSQFVRISRVAEDMERRSLPAMSGALSSAQSEKCARYSVSLIPPLPTSSMSGSFQPFGPANFAMLSCRSRIFMTEDHLSSMSPVVRQRLPPTVRPQCQGWPEPHSHRL